ncbi:FecCD family ABC transporter permease [Gephyromycinifex aptenodytis]|uniref:FecCD family ABC transporter permease n=1 Tax=Gephyromycinifex aptenodytis TaxID=2716227 RepID=UPI001446DB50|nr:iron chelate uptake ABC transporter family permease subunit [Gephyromycinifex aptenodytis]
MSTVAVRLAGERVSFAAHPRSVLVGLILAATALAATLAALVLGDITLPVGRVVQVLLGRGTGLDRLVVLDWRLPRALLALTVGATLGMSGAIFQAVTRNPLGSPDIIGFSTGATTGTLLVVLTAAADFSLRAPAAFAGGVVTVAITWLLTRGGSRAGLHLVLVGIAITAILTSVNRWLLLRADSDTALAASRWILGTLDGVGWEATLPATGLGLILCVATAAQARHLRIVALGDDLSTSLGVSPRRGTAVLVVLGTLLVAVATSVAGPIGFVALAAPHLARRLTGDGDVGPVTSALMGAALLSLCDLATGRLLPDLPVGVVTASLGGLFFVWLLTRELRRR